MPAAKLGLGYRWSGVKKLVDLVGPAYAKEIFYTARQFSAAEALAMGLVNRTLPEAELEAYVRSYCAMIAENAPLTLAAIKGVVAELAKPVARPRQQALRRARGALLRERGLRRRPPRLHGEAQARVPGAVAVLVALPRPNRRGPHPLS